MLSAAIFVLVLKGLIWLVMLDEQLSCIGHSMLLLLLCRCFWWDLFFLARGYIKFSCSTQLSMKLVLLINVKIIYEQEKYYSSLSEPKILNFLMFFFLRSYKMPCSAEHENLFITSGPGHLHFHY